MKSNDEIRLATGCGTVVARASFDRESMIASLYGTYQGRRYNGGVWLCWERDERGRLNLPERSAEGPPEALVAATACAMRKWMVNHPAELQAIYHDRERCQAASSFDDLHTAVIRQHPWINDSLRARIGEIERIHDYLVVYGCEDSAASYAEALRAIRDLKEKIRILAAAGCPKELRPMYRHNWSRMKGKNKDSFWAPEKTPAPNLRLVRAA